MARFYGFSQRAICQMHISREIYFATYFLTFLVIVFIVATLRLLRNKGKPSHVFAYRLA